MDFTRDIDVIDENGDAAIKTMNFHATLENNVAEVFAVDEDGNKSSLVLQPWKTEKDGTRSDWADLDDIVSWYQDLDIAF